MQSPPENISLPDDVAEDEELARIICASSNENKRKRYAFYFCDNEKKYIIRTGQFMEDRYPSTLSVNRVSSIPVSKAHELGEEWRMSYKPHHVYYGYGELTAQTCLSVNCKLEKDDLGGENPFHANILYPYPQKEDNQEIAVELAYKAKFVQLIKH